MSRRRGYVRPQGATFADSAKNRDSVMSLGSIAHLQYYFARTGMLDGKGGQLARDPKKGSSNIRVSISDATRNSDVSTLPSLGGELSQSPIGDEADDQDWDNELMLPPTVSTYSHRTQYIPPPPDAPTLRSELRESLKQVTKALEEIRCQAEEKSTARNQQSKPRMCDAETPANLDEPPTPGQRSPNRGWHTIQGMHMLDVVTLAIKAAKDYYTKHPSPQLLNKVASERQIREDLLSVMDVLKRMATRDFAGGMRAEEISTVQAWVGKVENFLAKEKEIEAQEARDRESWTWLDKSKWAIDSREREWEFMRTFLAEDEVLPSWTAPAEASGLPTPFLRALANGLMLIHLHNRTLKKSKRQFGRIDTFHNDTGKPYRAADNLRYWIKAAEIRWETKLRVDVLGVVYSKGDDVWREFDEAVLAWCRAVREDITKEWKAGEIQI